MSTKVLVNARFIIVALAMYLCLNQSAIAAQSIRVSRFSDVVGFARTLATQPFRPAPNVPVFLESLSYNQYQNIRFKVNKAVRLDASNIFQIEAVPGGLYYKHCVGISIVQRGHSVPLQFTRDAFTYPSIRLSDLMSRHPCVAGFKLIYPLNGPHLSNQFLVFAGASYLRAVGKSNRFGLSARGIAINTPFPPTEEFPAFRHFWLQKSRKKDRNIIIYALLDGQSVTGAYRFDVAPGVATTLNVNAVLFFRHMPRLLGIAPLTSMFLYGENTPRMLGEWRPSVHDSDGLQVENGDGEWIWRPLINPAAFLVSSFTLNNPQMFGLMQRDQRFASYEDIGARYDLRPSAWVEPVGNWGQGKVELVEIPSNSETEDNIVAYWAPRKAPQLHREYQFKYRLLFGPSQFESPPADYVSETFVGSGHNPGTACSINRGSLRFLIDFKGPSQPKIGTVKGVVSAGNNIRVSDVSVIKSRAIHGYRLSFLVAPEPHKALELRAFLQHGRTTMTETWSYLLPWENALRLLSTSRCKTVQVP